MISATELRNTGFLKDLTEPQLSALAGIATHSHWKEGETLFQAGSLAVYLYILKRGTILLCFENDRSLPIRGEGQAIGWSSLISPFKYTATALCLTDVHLFQFSGRELYRLIQMDAQLGQRLMLMISQVMEERKRYRLGDTQHDSAMVSID